MYFSAAATKKARRSAGSIAASAAPVTPARQTAFQLFVPVAHHSRGLPVRHIALERLERPPLQLVAEQLPRRPRLSFSPSQ